MKKRNPRHLMAVILFSFLLIAAIFITMLPNTLFQREKETGVTAGPEYSRNMGLPWYEGSVLSAAIG